MAVQLTDELSQEYERLFRTAKLHSDRIAAIDKIADRAVLNQARYEAVATTVGTPWYVIAAIHSLEAGQRFTTHLHNGDPLTARTVHQPPGRPKTGSPPFTWEVSAIDALTGHGFHKVGDWTLPVMLFRFEKYNGFGYRNLHPDVLSPYLWSFTDRYAKGKFVGDGVFSATAVSKQCGAAALLKRMVARKDITLPGAGRVVAMSVTASVVSPPFPGVALKAGDHGDDVCLVQARLRARGFTIANVAGCPFGPQTKKAVKAFQRAHGLIDSGRVGSDTWKALFG